MDLTSGGEVEGEVPAMLQLRKWERPLDLFNFRRAFISPTREQLLLHSYQSEAMIIPLLKGNYVDSRDLGNDLSSEPNSSIDNGYPFISGVKSLAWGTHGDTYNQHEETIFRELLFVCGDGGIMVHSFRQSNEFIETKNELTSEIEAIGDGTWTEWGPITPLDESVIESESSRNSGSKRWLRSFLTNAETLKSEDNVFTRFPKGSTLPLSAMVVSFSILGPDSPILGFLHHVSAMQSGTDGWEESVLDPGNNKYAKIYSSSSNVVVGPDFTSNLSVGGLCSSYKCSKVFSNSSHHFIGFVLTSVNPTDDSISDEREGNCSNIALVARLVTWGIHWACLVKLNESLQTDLSSEWADFGFSGDFLICLNAAGLILLFGVLSGKCLACVDVYNIFGLNTPLNSQENFTPQGDVSTRTSNIQMIRNDISWNQTGCFSSRRRFKRLLVISHSSVFGVADECGVIFILCADDHVPAKYISCEKSLLNSQHLGLGILIGWEVGGAAISHPRVFSNIPGCHNGDMLCPRSKVCHSMNTVFPNIHKEKRGHDSSYFKSSTALPNSMCQKNFFSFESSIHVMRKVFLPTAKLQEDDIICFSPFGITRLIEKCSGKDQRNFHINHTNLLIDYAVSDDRCVYVPGWAASIGEAIGCSFQGCVYLVTEAGLSVVFPSVSVSPNFLPTEAFGCQQPKTGIGSQAGVIFKTERFRRPWPPWKVEVLDRVLSYEGPGEADHLCTENDWDLRISRIRRLELALYYLKFEEIENSLEMLLDVNLAEEGILRLLFAVVNLIIGKVSNDNEVSAASRLLALATCFATKMLRSYGLSQHKEDKFMPRGITGTHRQSLPLLLAEEHRYQTGSPKQLQEMAYYLEIIRKLQGQLFAKFKKPCQSAEAGMLNLVDTQLSPGDSELTIVSADVLTLEMSNQHDPLVPVTDVGSNNEKLALMSMDASELQAFEDMENTSVASVLVSEGSFLPSRVFPLENPKDMIERWELNNSNLKDVVKDALFSGRLPLAVLKLHLHRLRNLVTDDDSNDTFSEVRNAGRAIAYDLFLKGATRLAVETLQKLGEEIDISLKQLLFGTVRRSLRKQIAEEMKNYGYLGPYEWKILEKMLLIESAYTCCSFWRTFCGRQKELTGVLCSPAEIHLDKLCPPFENHIIACGEIDGIILGPWSNLDEHTFIPEVDDDSNHVGYWAAAAAWSDAWDQRTIDRILLDQPLYMGVNLLWESQLEYQICHNDWLEVSKLLDLMPSYAVSYGSLQINLDSSKSEPTGVGNKGISDYGNYIYSLDELDAVCMDVPGMRIFKFSVGNMCSALLKTLMEQQLAKNLVFLKEYWEDGTEILAYLARSGFISGFHNISFTDKSIDSSKPGQKFTVCSGAVHPDAVHALHKLVVHHCIEYNLPNLLDLYLDHHKLGLESASLTLLQNAVGDSEWAKWLLLLRVKGHEYESSFSNARSIASHNLVAGNNFSVLEITDLIRNVDDIAEGAGEMAALATLMYAPIAIQDCLSSGSVNRYCSSSQCTMENLRPALQHFPTLWRALLAACFGQDSTCNFSCPRTSAMGYSDLSHYLSWRDNIFFSSGHDASLLQMIPCWFPKSVRRLLQLYIQGPLGWQSITGPLAGESPFIVKDIYYTLEADGHAEVSAIAWEASIQKHIEKELYASSLEESGHVLEHHLHRGRALAAFNHLLATRVHKLKLENTHRGQSDTSVHGQANIQSDVHALLAPIQQSEESLLSSIMPLAILHFEDSVLVASCAFLLEIGGLSTSMLRIDVVTLKRILSFYNSSGQHDLHNLPLSKGSKFHSISLQGNIAESLAQALADDYLHHDGEMMLKQNENSNNFSDKEPSPALMLVLHHLEKACLPLLTEGMTCGSWLLRGKGDGTELRTQQKAASQDWHLVTEFCQMHQIPTSTKYLAILARDNDWVGFLSEGQMGGYSFDAVIQVASKEFSDPRLKVHILTVLKSMQSKKQVTLLPNSDSGEERNEVIFSDENIYIPVELFDIIADCEKQKYPGQAILLKAKDLCWSILAVIASCFQDVSPLSCLTVWLEINAARDTSSIKVNDIAAQIANNVGAAVEATNSLPPTGRTRAFHYNRKNPKRRHLMESASVSSFASTMSDASIVDNAKLFAVQGIIAEKDRVRQAGEHEKVSSNSDEVFVSLSKLVAVLCEQHLFLPLLRAFEMFLPSCSLLPFIRALQAFYQMRLAEASAHLGSFSSRLKEEATHIQTNIGKEGQIGNSWISSIAMKAADAMISTCPSPYEKRCLLKLLAAADFGDGGHASAYYRQLYWKINMAEPSLRKDNDLHLGNEILDDASLLTALEENGHWDHARNWAKQMEVSAGTWKSAVHNVTEAQAEAMVTEWKEFLWDVSEERAALWGHCQTLFLRYSFPALQAGLFFLKHAEALEKDLPPMEVHELLVLSLQWLSGMITQSNQVYPFHLLREIETRVWLLAVESEAQVKSDGEFTLTSSSREPGSGKSSNIIDHTASIIAKMDNHINNTRFRTAEQSDARENNQMHNRIPQVTDANFSASGNAKIKRRAKGLVPSIRSLNDTSDRNIDSEDGFLFSNSKNDLHFEEENCSIRTSFSRWEERLGPAELERAVLSLLEFGQITAAKQLQNKLSPGHVPSEFLLVDTAKKLAAISTMHTEVSPSLFDDEVQSVIQSYNLVANHRMIDPLQALENLSSILMEGRGRGLCKRIISVVRAAKVLGLSFSEAFDKQPIELLQLLSLKAQDSFEEANLLVQTHSMPAASIAQILAESFLKGLLAAHRGGYMDSQKEEGPAPLLWRFSDFLKWAELCPSEPEIGHALMRLVITGQEIPHACEVELLILSHHFYKSSACLDGVDVLVALAATRVEAYVSEGDFSCLARLITGVGNFHALNFILGILIENGQLDLLLQKFSAAADTNAGTAEAVRGFRMAVLTSLKQFNPNDLDAFAMVYNHFDMKHETASLLESRAQKSSHQWFLRYDKDQNEDLLESMRYYIEAAEVHSSIDAGNKTRTACARASLVSLQIRMPDYQWLNLSETNARRLLVEQSRFQEALIVAEAYGVNQPSEWALVLWNQMLKPELTEQFVAEFVAVLPLQPSMLMELAKFYRAEMAARRDQSQFSVWLTGGGLPAEWAKYLGRSFRCLLKRTRDLRIRLHLATLATGFSDVIDACMKALDRFQDNTAPLVLRKGHGGGYLPLICCRDLMDSF